MKEHNNDIKMFERVIVAWGHDERGWGTRSGH